MYTKNEPGANPVNEPKAKPCYTEFMFVDDEIFDDELFEELLDPDYKLYDEIQDMEVDDEINGYNDVDEIDDKHFEPEAEPENNESNEPEAEPEHDYPKYRIYEHPKFAEYYDEAFNHDRILKDVNCGIYLVIPVISYKNSTKMTLMIEGKEYDYHKFFKECHGIKPLTKEQHEYFDRKREARRLEENMKRKKKDEIKS